MDQILLRRSRDEHTPARLSAERIPCHLSVACAEACDIVLLPFASRSGMGASDYVPTSVWHNHPPPNSLLRRTESTEVTSWPTPSRSGASHFRAGTAPESHHRSVGRIAIGRTPVKPLRPITAPHTFLAADVHEALPKLSAWSSMPATPLTGLMSPGQRSQGRYSRCG